MLPREDKALENMPKAIQQAVVAAREYARDVIQQSSTSLKNLEGLDRRKRSDVKTKKEELQEKVARVAQARKHSIEEAGKNLLGNVVKNSHKAGIEVSKQFRMGNCGEYSAAVVDFIAEYEEDLRAEIMEINGGNHVIAVIQRDPTSNPKDPGTWGDQAVIVDAWANISYPATQYMTHLKALELDAQGFGVSVGFDHEKHELFLYPFYNTETLRQEASFEKISSDYRSKLSELVALCRKVKGAITRLMSNLDKSKESSKDKKQGALQEKLLKIEKCEDALIIALKESTNEKLYEIAGQRHGTDADLEEIAKTMSNSISQLTQLTASSLLFSKNDKNEAILFEKPKIRIIKKETATEKKVKEINSAISATIDCKIANTYNPHELSGLMDRIRDLQQMLEKKIESYDADARTLSQREGVLIAPDQAVNDARVYLSGTRGNTAHTFCTREEYQQEARQIQELSANVEVSHANVLHELKATDSEIEHTVKITKV